MSVETDSYEVIESNIALDAACYNFLRVKSLIILRSRINQEGFISGDIDVFCPLNNRKELIKSFKFEFRERFQTKEISCFGATGIVILDENLCSLLRVDLHFEERWYFIRTLGNHLLQKNTLLNHMNNRVVSDSAHNWLKFCFCFLNRDFFAAKKYWEDVSQNFWPNSLIQSLVGYLFSKVGSRLAKAKISMLYVVIIGLWVMHDIFFYPAVFVRNLKLSVLSYAQTFRLQPKILRFKGYISNQQKMEIEKYHMRGIPILWNPDVVSKKYVNIFVQISGLEGNAKSRLTKRAICSAIIRELD